MNAMREKEMTTLELLAFAKDKARLCFEESGEHIPLILADIEGMGGVTPIGMPWGSTEEKALILEGVREMFKKYAVRRCVFISEVWMALVPEGGVTVTPASERADRTEALFISAEEDGAEIGSGFFPIIRDGGKPRCGAWQENEAGFSGGRLTGFTAHAATRQ